MSGAATSLLEIVAAHASVHPERPACIHAGKTWSYAELAADVDTCACRLAALGVSPGDRVAFFGLPEPNYLISFLAAMRVGATWLGLNPKYTADELAYVLQDSQPALCLLVTDFGVETAALEDALSRTDRIPSYAIGSDLGDFAPFSAVAPRSLPDVAPDAPAALVYTSGSTGAPKGALLTHRGLVAAGQLYVSKYPARGLTTVLCNLPINHVGCLCDTTATALCAGGTLVFEEHFLPHRIGPLIDAHAITHVGQVPTMWRYILDEDSFAGAELTSLEWTIWSGAPMPVPLAEKLAAYGKRLSNCYGMTETTGCVTFTDPSAPLADHCQTIGAPAEPENFRLRDISSGVDIREPGTPGEIQVRGNYVFAGYLGADDKTATAFDDGWYCTGDLGEWTEGGVVRLVGRIKEMFKSGGYNVYPREIEAVLEAFPGIEAAAVIPSADEVFHEVGHAYLIGSPDISAADLDGWCRTRLANYKIPKAFHVAAELPLLPIGKIDKTALKARVAEASPA